MPYKDPAKQRAYLKSYTRRPGYAVRHAAACSRWKKRNRHRLNEEMRKP
jgi:hypothetical protein